MKEIVHNLVIFLMIFLVAFSIYAFYKQKNLIKETQETKATQTLIETAVIEDSSPAPSLFIKKGDPNCAPRFEDYPVETYAGETAPINFASKPEAREYKTAITQAHNKGLNFAGEYVIAEWGCGTGCRNFAVSNVKTGAVVQFPGYAYMPNGASVYTDVGSSLGYEFNYKPTSRLFSISPPLAPDDYLQQILLWANEEGNVAGGIRSLVINYFDFNDNKFELVCQKNYIEALKNRQ